MSTAAPDRPGLEVAGLAGELDAVMRGIVRHLMALPGADGASLSTLSGKLAHFDVCAGEDAPLEGRTMPIADTLGDECLRRGELTVLRATEGTEVTRCLTPGAGAIVLAPIEYDGRIRGILGVRSASPDAFDDSDVHTIRMLTSGAEIALRNAELVQRLGESELAYRTLHAQAADAAIVTDPSGRIIDANDAATVLLGRSLAELRGLRSSELFPDAGAARADTTFVRDGENLQLEYSARRLPDGRTHTTLRDVTQRRRTEDRLRTSLGRMHAIVETQQEIAALELDGDAVTAAIVERAQRLCGGDGAAVHWFEGYDYVVKQGSGIAAPHVGERVDRARSLSAIAALSGEVVSVPDVEQDTRIDRDPCRRMGARSVICAPLYRSGTAVGALSIVAARPGAFDELAVETARMMAEFVSTVIRNADELDERRRLVEALRLQGEVVKNMQIALWVWRTDGDGFRLDYANDASADATGVPVDDILSRTLPEVLPAAPQLQDVFREVRDSGVPLDLGDLEYGDDRIPAGIFSAKAFPLPAGRVAMTFEDVTAKRDASLLFAATFEQSVVPKLIVDDDRRIVEVNSAAAELLGIAHDRAIELTVDELVPDEPVTELWSEFQRRGTLEAEVWLQRPDGGRRRIDFVATANVRPHRHIAVVRDLTRQRELELQLNRAQKMEAVGRLAGGVAHDFNNLLTAITGYSEFLIDGLDDEELHRHAEEIRRASGRAAALTGQLLAFSRRQVMQPRVLDLNTVVADMDMMLRRLIGEDVELVTIPERALWSVVADPTQLEQVIVNLTVNAREAMPQGGAVTIETANVVRDGARFVELRIADTGVGISDAERAQLFDPFFTTKDGGTGLGLATVYGIVEQSGGRIEVDSAPGHGATFRVLLPAADEQAEPPAPEPAAERPRTGTETILLVEDELVVRHLVAEILEGGGYTVLQAGDGPSALELLRRHGQTVDLLLTDVVMPGMSGPEVATSVLALRPGTRVLYISGYTDSAIDQHGVLEPGIAFLQKPFSADELTRKVRALLDA